MYLTTVNRMKLSKSEHSLLSEMCWQSKNLYNATLYRTRQYYFNTNKLLSYISSYHLLKHEESRKFLPSQVAQQTMMVVERSMKSFFGVLREKRKGNYNRPLRLPKYLPKDGKFVLIFTPSHIRYANKSLVNLTINKELKIKYNIKKLSVAVPKHIIGKIIKEIRINPCDNFFKVEYVYLDIEIDKVEVNSKFMSIDLGLNNLCTMINNVDNQPTIIDGRELKSYNRLSNKTLSKVQSLAKKVNNSYKTNKTSKLYFKRGNFIKDKFHKISNHIIKECLEKGISKIIIGYNMEWKQDVNLGKKNNQNFCQIPHGKLISYLQYKAEQHGIEVILQEESYTSKCDSLALEKVRKHEIYSGKRISRGLFKSGNGKVLNADLNGAINTARKCIGESLDLWVKDLASSGFVNNPKRIRLASLG